MGSVPQTRIERLRAQFEKNRYNAIVVGSLGLKPGKCATCDINLEHPAHVVVTTALSDEWTEPATYLNGWSTASCWGGLCQYIQEQHEVESFDGCTIEVPT